MLFVCIGLESYYSTRIEHSLRLWGLRLWREHTLYTCLIQCRFSLPLSTLQILSRCTSCGFPWTILIELSQGWWNNGIEETALWLWVLGKSYTELYSCRRNHFAIWAGCGDLWHCRVAAQSGELWQRLQLHWASNWDDISKILKHRCSVFLKVHSKSSIQYKSPSVVTRRLV